MRLERHAREKTFVLSEAQIRLLERHSLLAQISIDASTEVGPKRR
jgi:hypothetical protein